MSVQQERPPRPAHRTADYDAEQEVDFGRYGRALAVRWWLPLVGVVAGVIVGYMLSLGGAQVYQATALVELGTPLAPGGGLIPTLASNPRSVDEVVRSATAQNIAARAAGERAGAIRGNVSTESVTGAVAKSAQVPLVKITLTGSRPTKVAAAANSLAQTVVERTSTGYVNGKIRALQQQRTGQSAEIVSIDQRIALLDQATRKSSLAFTDRLLLTSEADNLEQRRTNLVNQQAQTEQALEFAKTNERSSIVEPAAAVKTTARSRRNSILVAALIGLIVGALVALLWEPFAGRLGRRPA